MPIPSLSSIWQLPANSPQYIFQGCCSVVWNISLPWSIFLAMLGHLSWPCPLPASCAPVCGQSMGQWKVLDLGKALSIYNYEHFPQDCWLPGQQRPIAHSTGVMNTAISPATSCVLANKFYSLGAQSNYILLVESLKTIKAVHISKWEKVYYVYYQTLYKLKQAQHLGQ